MATVRKLWPEPGDFSQRKESRLGLGKSSASCCVEKVEKATGFLTCDIKIVYEIEFVSKEETYQTWAIQQGVKLCYSQLNYYINPELCVGGWAPSLRRVMCITLIHKGHENLHTLCCRISYPNMYSLAQESLFCALRQCFVHSPCRQTLSCLHVGQSINCSCLGCCWFLISYTVVFIFTGSCDRKLMFC